MNESKKAVMTKGHAVGITSFVNPFIAAAMQAMNPLHLSGLDLAAMQPAPRKRKGKGRANVKSQFSNRQQRQFYRSKYAPHQGKLEKIRREMPGAWAYWRGTGTNRNLDSWS